MKNVSILLGICMGAVSLLAVITVSFIAGAAIAYLVISYAIGNFGHLYVIDEQRKYSLKLKCIACEKTVIVYWAEGMNDHLGIIGPEVDLI